MALSDSKKDTSITRAEHVSVDDGENINAKRTAGYVWDAALSEWVRSPKALTLGHDFDYIGVANNSSTQDTLTYKNGGASGNTVRTLVITYAAGASKISDDITSLDYS